MFFLDQKEDSDELSGQLMITMLSLSKWVTRNDPRNRGLQFTCHEMVGWYIIFCTTRHEESHVIQYISWQGLNIININNTKLNTRRSK